MDGTTENIRQIMVYMERWFVINCFILFIKNVDCHIQ